MSISGEETVKDNVQIFGVRNTIAIVIVSNGVDLVGGGEKMSLQLSKCHLKYLSDIQVAMPHRKLNLEPRKHFGMKIEIL